MGKFHLVILFCGVHQAIAAPVTQDNEENLPPIYFKDGTVGVNFLGFKASAGLGGLLTGDASHGGLHAEAETPFGQKAGAGLGGIVDENGRSAGGLYAGATAGGGVGAMAGLDGAADKEGSIGRSYAGASAGGKTVIKERVAVPAAGASLSGSFNIQKVAPVKPATVDIELVKEKVISSPPPRSQVKIEVEKEVVAPAVKKTYVERTVIPNYVEKTIQVPSYVEKTIRVPTVIEKKVKVPAPPTIIEKEVEIPQPVKTKHESAVVYKTKTKFHRRPWLRKHISINSGEVPYYGGVVAADAGVGGHFGYSAETHPVTYTKTVRKQFNGDLIRDIFNIPISTLNAVGNLVGNVAAGTSGSVSLSKSYGAAY